MNKSGKQFRFPSYLRFVVLLSSDKKSESRFTGVGMEKYR